MLQIIFAALAECLVIRISVYFLALKSMLWEEKKHLDNTTKNCPIRIVFVSAYLLFTPQTK